MYSLATVRVDANASKQADFAIEFSDSSVAEVLKTFVDFPASGLLI